MKKIKIIFRIILICSLTLAFYNCKKNKVVEPFFNYSTFTDSRDGQTYKYIKIGTQEWMAENLSFATASGSTTFYNSAVYGAQYGRLYTWDAAVQAAPIGWHLPTDAEWKQLEMSLGMSQKDANGIGARGTNEGGKLKSTNGWAGNKNGTDAVGFSALPGGIQMNSGGFDDINWKGYWWSASDSTSLTAWIRLLDTSDSRITRVTSFKEDKISIRCVKD